MEQPYHLHLRRAVVFLFFVEGLTMDAISMQFGGHPNRDTVSRMIREYEDVGFVTQCAGKKGLQHKDRKFDLFAWETLIHLIQEEEQDTLQSESVSYVANRMSGLSSVSQAVRFVCRHCRSYDQHPWCGLEHIMRPEGPCRSWVCVQMCHQSSSRGRPRKARSLS